VSPSAGPLVLLAALGGGAALAQDASPDADVEGAAAAPADPGEGQPEEDADDDEDLRPFELIGRGWASLSAGIDDGPGEVAVYRARAQGSARLAAGPVRLSLGVANEQAVYDFRDAHDLDPPRPALPEDPWDRLETVELRLGGLAFLSRSWALRVDASVRAGFERRAELERSISVAAFAGLAYSLSEELRFTFGLGVITRIEESPLVIPALGVSWTPAEWVTIDVRGPRVEVTLRPGEDVDVLLGVAWDNRQYRLAKGRSFYDRHIVEDQAVVVRLGAAWRPAPAVELGASAGLVAYREVELRAADGDDVYRLQLDPTAAFEVAATVRF